jgi:membrane associated rhomboid family serine protease
MLERLAVHHPYAGRGLPLLGSTFSHQTPDHLFFNMFALGTLGTLRLHSLTLAG